jgi:predicted house-cleaning NTP pyrophosphatase (Maf/HAM1 superfamily)
MIKGSENVNVNVNFVRTFLRKKDFKDVALADFDLSMELLDLEKEFNIILESIESAKVVTEISCVQRARMMAQQDPNSFYTLAAQTIASCKTSNYNKLEKYHKIYACLKKTREVVDVNSFTEMAVLKKVEEIVESFIDIFDY